MRDFLIIILSLSTYVLSGQTLAFFGDAMINAVESEHRVYASERFDEMFALRAGQEDSFHDDLKDLASISVQYAPDETFRVISWQVDEGDGKFRYQGYFQKNTGELYGFDSRSGRDSYQTDRPSDITEWKGALVYKVLSIKGEYYMLTFKMLDAFTKVKTLELLTIEEGSISLGRANAFDMKKRGSTSRIALVHSVDSNVQITYEDVSSRFIFDNLIAVQGRIEGQGPTFVPDGSYRAFENQEGQWKYIDKLYSQVNDGALDPAAQKKINREPFKKKN